MASSSSASVPKHDVFLSFRGETRNNFLSHLYENFRRKAIDVYADFKELPRGEEISYTLLEAIVESKISIIVFSQNYATSSWCLDELSKIMECRRSRGQLVVPIFYHVNPSDIRKQTGSFGKAFTEHERNRTYKVQGWRHALTEAGNLSGWSLARDKPESLVIDDIVRDILNKLSRLSKSNYSDLIGIIPSMEQIKSMLCIGGDQDVHIIGIWGMGGIGKTTLAQAIYDEVSSQFDSCYFLENVREGLEKHGAIALRDKLLSKLLDQENLQISTPMIGTLVIDRLRRKRVVVVLDDVSDFSQLEKLGINRNHFGFGSRIIITSRDQQVLRNGSVDDIYEVKELSYDDSLQLFSMFAFKKNHPIDDFKDLSNRFLEYCKGVPIALKVLGSALYQHNMAYWESSLNGLGQYPYSTIQDVLKISFSGLDEVEREIFLDIACFFKDYNRDRVTKILDSCYACTAHCKITNLIDKCLLTVTNGNMLGMHDLIQEMGRNVARAEPRDPEKRSRLWTTNEVCRVLKNGTGTISIEGILLDQSQISDFQLHPRAFTKMRHLRIIKFHGKGGKLVPSHRPLKSLPDELRYLEWEYCMLKSIPSNFSPENLVELKLPNSNVEQLWNGEQNLVNLRVLDLSYCKNLTRIPNLSLAKKLESLSIDGCNSLVELPSLIHLNSFRRYLRAGGCPKLKKFPELPLHIEILILNKVAIEEVPSSISELKSLFALRIADCPKLKRLPTSIRELKSLKILFLDGCSNLECFPEISETECLYQLNLCGTAIKEVPESISGLKSLRVWSMSDCTKLKSLPTSICKLKSLGTLTLNGCSNLEYLPASIYKLKSLRELDLNGCSNLEYFPEILETMRYLYKLYLGRTAIKGNIFGSGNSRNFIVHDSFCNLVWLTELGLSGLDIVEIPEGIKQLPNLIVLYLSCCKSLKSLPELPPSLQILNAEGCTSLETVPRFCSNKKGRGKMFASEDEYRYKFNNCFNLDRDAVNNIVASAQLTSQCMAEEYVMKPYKGIRENQEKTVICCFPGSEISETFKNRSTNSSITVQLSPPCSNKRFLGFFVCIVVDFEHHQLLYVRYKLRLKTECGDHHDFKPNCPSELQIQVSESIESNHVILLFDALRGIFETSRDKHFDEASFEFSVEVDDYEREGKQIIEVQKCGVNVLYVDAVRSNDKEVESSADYRLKRSSCFDEEEEPDPQRPRYSH